MNNPGNGPVMVAHQFEDPSQQREAATMGMWLFIATEILFFGGMFLGYTAYRYEYAGAFAEASKHTLLAFGGTNTAILLISSSAMAFGVRAAGHNQNKKTGLLLFITAGLGLLFLVLKGIEYTHEIREHLFPGSGFEFEGHDPQHAQLFFYLYWLMTGVHALHVFIGVVLISIFGILAWRHDAYRNHDTPVELLGLYWHFVDIVWVFLFPLIYLIDRHP